MEIWKVWEEEEKRTEHEESRVRRLVVSVVCWRTERGKNYDECRVNPVVFSAEGRQCNITYPVC